MNIPTKYVKTIIILMVKYYNGKTLYNGEYKNDKLNGIGISYYVNGNISLNGKWILNVEPLPI